jgi:hypothetical protein
MEIDRSLLGEDWDGLLVFVLRDEAGLSQVFPTMEAARQAAVENRTTGTINIHAVADYASVN